MPRTSLGAGCRQLGPLRSGRSDSLFGANYRFAARLLGLAGNFFLSGCGLARFQLSLKNDRLFQQMCCGPFTREGSI